MSEVLSQSQIDALLNSMKGGCDDSAAPQEKEEKKEEEKEGKRAVSQDLS